MRLPSGDLAETDEDNAKVFVKHFGKVLNNNNSINNNVLNNINSHEVMNELNVPPSWKEFTEAVKDITNNKAPGLNGVPPNTFKAMSPENLKFTSTLFSNFGMITWTLKNGTRVK